MLIDWNKYTLPAPVDSSFQNDKPEPDTLAALAAGDPLWGALSAMPRPALKWAAYQSALAARMHLAEIERLSRQISSLQKQLDHHQKIRRVDFTPAPQPIGA